MWTYIKWIIVFDICFRSKVKKLLAVNVTEIK